MFINTDSYIKAVAFGKVDQNKGFWHSGRQLEFYLLIYCTSGKMTIKFDDNEYSLCTGDILIVPKNTMYFPLHSPGCSYIFFHFDAAEANKSIENNTLQHGAILPTGQYHYQYTSNNDFIVELDVLTKSCNIPNIHRTFEKISELDPYHNFSEMMLINNILREIIILISKQMRENKRLNKHIIEITNYIKQSFYEHISLSSLSNKFKLSETYIAKIFNQDLKMRPSDYVNRVRISSACDLLIHTDSSVCEISEKVGYSSLYYFSRTFKKHCKISPSEFRKRGILH